MQLYPYDKETIQGYIDMLLMNPGSQSGGKSVFLRKASDDGIIDVGLLAGTAVGTKGDHLALLRMKDVGEKSNIRVVDMPLILKNPSLQRMVCPLRCR